LESYGQADPAFLAQSRPEGPKIIAPVWIHPTAKIHASAVIGPNVSIDANCVVGEGVRVKESVILPGVKLRDNSCIIDAIIGWNSTIGTWSRVEGSPLGEAASHEDTITQNGKKKPSVTILSGDIHVSDERCVRNCIVLPHKSLTENYHNEIVM
jgi:mannose-1-phosphate guanylyltransferase